MSAISKNRVLGFPELTAIAIGGMVGGGIFSILGVSVSVVGGLAPLSILLGGVIASAAAYSYVKLGVYYEDEGATYSFFKKTFTRFNFGSAAVGWYITFGYVSTMALYAFTFASYLSGGLGFGVSGLIQKLFAGGILLLFLLINLWSVKGMGKVEDIMVYVKLVILVTIAVLLIINGKSSNYPDISFTGGGVFDILVAASITFVAYEGFKLVIHAVKEMKTPKKNIPKSIYTAIAVVILLYCIIAFGALFSIPVKDIVNNKEYALAAGAEDILGNWGKFIVIGGALLSTASAISGTVFGSARMMAVIAKDGYLPAFLKHKRGTIPDYALITITIFAFALILTGGLQLILEFGSITFLIVSFLIAYTNFKIRHKTGSSKFMTVTALITLAVGAVLILYYEFTHKIEQIFFIFGIYALLIAGAYFYARSNKIFKKLS